MTKIAGCPATAEQIRGTIRMLSYYRNFIRSNCTHCKDPGLSGRDAWMGNTMTKEQAQRRLWFLVNTAINRKAAWQRGIQ
jgi:hypothetical protein